MKSKSFRLLACLVFGVGFSALGACGTSLDSLPCQTSADCPSDLICFVEANGLRECRLKEEIAPRQDHRAPHSDPPTEPENGIAVPAVGIRKLDAPQELSLFLAPLVIHVPKSVSDNP